jgi:hypothetical protein
MWIVALALRRPYTFTVFARLSDPKKRRQNWNLAFQVAAEKKRNKE